MSEIKLNKISRDYGLGNFGVRDVSLEINEGEFMVLLGPSGCGKSTTLRMIAGLEQTTGGQISIAGRDVTNLAPRLRNVAVVFQSYALYPHMSVRENMRFGMKMRKTPRDEQDRRIAQAASVLSLEPYLDRKPAALSGGQRQRVALGRAIVREPDVFLMDEPLSNLDAKLRGEMRQELVKLHRRVGKTTVFVTHDHVEAMTMGDRICIMRNGRIEQVGAPLEVYARPRNTFVAQFLATPAMNLIEAHLSAERETVTLSAGPITGPLPEREAAVYRSAVGTGLLFGLRAEDILTRPKPGAQAFQATVTVLEALGPENLIFVEAAGQSVSARVERDFLPRIGDTITLFADLAHMHLFDAASGDVIVREV